MEDALAPPSVAPTPSALAAAAVFTRRRSHLDSASFRTLSRLFSHCLHINQSPCGIAPPEPEPVAADPVGGDSDDSPERPNGADCDRLKDVEIEAADAGGLSLYGAVYQPAAANPTLDLGESEALKHEGADAVLVVESTSGMTRAEVEESAALVVESTSCKTSAEVEESAVVAGLVAVEDLSLKSVESLLGTKVDESVEVAVGDDEGRLLLEAMMTDFTGLIDDVDAGVISAQSCAVSAGDLQNSKASEESKQLDGGIEEGEPLRNCDHEQNGGGGFEEGEIEGEFQDFGSEESVDSEHGDEDGEDEKLEGNSISRGSGPDKTCDHGTQFGNLHSTPEIGNDDLILNRDAIVRGDAQIPVTRAQAVTYDDVVDWNENPLPDNEAPNPGKKRKRTQTEQRKAKKAKNKRINRALQQIADGVRRPKLTRVIKPKKPCYFYDHGKCQQGNNCKYSHDFTPSTKSKPCTHFACGSCLKGEGCPYDHELSKYECHNYKNNGMCARGDKCKFSHVMRTTEGTPTQDAKTSDVSLAYEKTNLREHTRSQKNTTVHNGAPSSSILRNLTGVSSKSQNVSNRIPKGVQFRPFGKGQSNLSSLHLDALSMEKQRNANGTQHNLGGHEAERQKIVKQNYQKPNLLLEDKNSSKEATRHPCSDLKKITLPVDSIATPGSIHTQHEVSEASRILQEFLFGAGS
ncbi:hypothetical protein BDA96_03G210900 [Sorghum bicolor]|uniref:C3H1-type domain-containing protein n=1 Tax=Sorghum bicolor TaxID=4558 RepID=A0A921UMZ5_SORBI|nr:hypothetical protein BDA96_03G210900 [Sorghum bicolor]